MKARLNRIDVVKKILLEKEVGSQDELLQLLKEMGYCVTQATLSRDLRLLKVAKVMGNNGRYIYVLPENMRYKRVGTENAGITTHRHSAFRSIRFSGNMAVIHTKPGYASGLASEIDVAGFSQIIGTIAGDDTIVIIMAEGITPEQLKDSLRTIVPNI